MEKNLEDLIEKCRIRNEKEIFKVGDSVKTSMRTCNGGTILEEYENSLFKVEFSYLVEEGYPKKISEKSEIRWFGWYDLSFQSKTNNKKENKMNDLVYIKSFKNGIGDLFRQYLGGYLDMNPSYQRDLVWSDLQKKELLDSIFADRNIGSFVVIEENFDYELLDGKQRLTTIFEFMLSRFSYNGKYFHELSKEDRSMFRRLMVNKVEMSPKRKLTVADKVTLFLDINTTGTPVSKEHLDNIREKYIK